MNYFEVNALSYSSLKSLSVGPAYFKSIKETEDKDHFTIGSAVDCLLTEPDNFWEYFFIKKEDATIESPTGQMFKFINYLVYNENCGEITDNCYQEAFEYTGFKQKKLKTVIEEFQSNYQDYYNWCLKNKKFFEDNKHKKELSPEQYNLVTNIVQSLRNNRFTKKYFENTIGQNIEKHYQLEIYWEYKNEKCKSKLDFVIIDHDNKSIKIIDLKTTAKSTFSFKSAVLQFRYDLQATFYTAALNWLIYKSDDFYWNSLKTYTFDGFYFIVESTKTQGLPLIYKCSENFIEKGLTGFTLDSKYYKGIIELVNDFKWYNENNEWTYEKEIIENQGIINLDIC